MSLKSYRNEEVWTPEELTWRQRLALKWPRALDDGAFWSAVIYILAIAAVFYLLVPIGVVLALGAQEISVLAPFIVIAILIVCLQLELVIFRSISNREMERMRKNHSFRFDEMQQTPGFKIFRLYERVREWKLKPTEGREIEDWLRLNWSADVFDRSEKSSSLVVSKHDYEQTKKRVTSFLALDSIVIDDRLREEFEQYIESLFIGYLAYFEGDLRKRKGALILEKAALKNAEYTYDQDLGKFNAMRKTSPHSVVLSAPER